MKTRTLCLSLLLLSQTALAEVRSPRWAEFVPVQYENSQIGDVSTRWTPGMYGLAILGILAPPVFVVLAKESRKLKDASAENDYWARRRNQFNLALEACQEDPEQGACYRELRHDEINKTASHEQHLDNIALRRSVRSLQRTVQSLQTNYR